MDYIKTKNFIIGQMTNVGKSSGISIHREDMCSITAKELEPIQALVAAYIESVLEG